jgi:hypothetical protein
MSEDVIERRARTLEALLVPVPASGRPALDLSEAATEDAAADVTTPEPAEVASDGEGTAESVEADPPETAAADDPREVMMVARIGALLGHPGTWQAPAAAATLPAALLAEVRASVAAPETVADADPHPEPTTAAQPGDTSPAAVPPTAVPPTAVPPAVVPPAAVPPVAVPPAAARRRWRWPDLRWTPPRLALGVVGGLAAVLLAVVMFGGDLLNNQTGTDRPVAVIQLVGTNAAPQAHAELRATERDAGWRLVVDIDGLAPAQPDEYYQGWAVHDQEMVPLGTFHMHQQGEVELWSGVPLKKFSRIEVTTQRVGGGQTPGVLVMVGQI